MIHINHILQTYLLLLLPPIGNADSSLVANLRSTFSQLELITAILFSKKWSMRNKGLSLDNVGSLSLIGDVCVLHSGFTEIKKIIRLA